MSESEQHPDQDATSALPDRWSATFQVYATAEFEGGRVVRVVVSRDFDADFLTDVTAEGNPFGLRPSEDGLIVDSEGNATEAGDVSPEHAMPLQSAEAYLWDVPRDAVSSAPWEVEDADPTDAVHPMVPGF